MIEVNFKQVVSVSVLICNIAARTCIPLVPPKNGQVSGNSRYVRLVCNSGFSSDPSLPDRAFFVCREGNFKMYHNRQWTIFTKVPDCVGKNNSA